MKGFDTVVVIASKATAAVFEVSKLMFRLVSVPSLVSHSPNQMTKTLY